MDVQFKGPLFDGNLAAKSTKHFDRARDDIGEMFVNRVRARLSNVLVNPTGHYRSRITYTVRRDSTLVTDSGVVYGPWLEGTSSRNTRTRFKGYATFRKVTQESQRSALTLVESEAASLVRELQ